MARQRPNTEKAYLDAVKAGKGRGQGSGKDYEPWLKTSDFTHSTGSRSRFYCLSFGRIIHLLSHAEAQVFLMLEWREDVVQIYEQYPLNPEFSKKAAAALGLKHPGSNLPGGFVMTTDFLVRFKHRGEHRRHAVQVKSSREDTANPRSQEKLRIEQEYWRQCGVSWEVIYASDLNPIFIDNLETLAPHRNARFHVQDLSYLADFVLRAAAAFPDADSSQLSEAVLDLPSGQQVTAWDAVLILTGKRLLKAPLEERSLFDCTLQDFGLQHV